MPRYVPPELKKELKRLFEKKIRYQMFLDKPEMLEKAIKKLDVDIENYNMAIKDVTDSIYEESSSTGGGKSLRRSWNAESIEKSLEKIEKEEEKKKRTRSLV